MSFVSERPLVSRFFLERTNAGPKGIFCLGFRVQEEVRACTNVRGKPTSVEKEAAAALVRFSNSRWPPKRKELLELGILVLLFLPNYLASWFNWSP